MSLLPSLVTTAALVLGFWAIILATQGAFNRAAWCIMLAAICDTLDGRIARATGSSSAFGVEYDSLSDLVSFGLAPAMVVYLWVLEPLGQRGWLIAALFVLCAALRLARFNVGAQDGDSVWYQGLPTTAAGMMVAVGVWFGVWVGLESPVPRPVGAMITAGFACMALLMVSPFPYPSLKLIKVEGRFAYPMLVGAVLFFIALLLNREWLPFILGLVFLATGPVLWWRRRKVARGLSPEHPEPQETSDG